MSIQKKIVGMMFVTLWAITGMGAMRPDHPTGDALLFLKRAITQASAPALTAQQETDLSALITAYKNSLPTGPDELLEAARDAYDAAIIAGNLTAAQTQAGVIAARQAELSKTRLSADAKFKIDVLANLKTGGQLTLLVEKYGNDRVLSIVGSLAGHIGRGPRGGGR